MVMSIQLIHEWSSIKHTDYSSLVLRECHDQANVAARHPDVENNPVSNQVNISHTQVNLHNRDWQIKVLDPKRFIKIIIRYCLRNYHINILHGFLMVQICKDFSLGWWNALATAWHQASAILKIWHCGSHFALVYAIVHEKPQMDIRESWHNCPWQYFHAGSLSYLYPWLLTTWFYLYRGTSHIDWHVLFKQE